MFENGLRDPLGPGASVPAPPGRPHEFGRLISQTIVSENETYYHHYDALGSTAVLTDGDEVVTDEYAYEAFGETAAESGPTPNPHLWVAETGYRKDEETGLYDLRRRKYSPQTGRFASEDPICDDEENLYRYVGNRTIGETDPSGLDEPTHEKIINKYKGSLSGSYEINVAYELWLAALHRRHVYDDFAKIGRQWKYLRTTHNPQSEEEAVELATNDYYIAAAIDRQAESYDKYLERLDNAAVQLARGFAKRGFWSKSELHELYLEWSSAPRHIEGLNPSLSQLLRRKSAQDTLNKALADSLRSTENTADFFETGATVLDYAQLTVATAFGAGGAYKLKQEGQKRAVKFLVKYFGGMLLASEVVVPLVQKGARQAGASEEEVYYGRLVAAMILTLYGGWRSHKDRVRQNQQNQSGSGKTDVPKTTQPQKPANTPKETRKQQPPENVVAPAPKVGETASTTTGKRIHKAIADARRASGEFDLVQSPITDKAGNPILVSKRVDLKTGKPQPGSPLQEAVPDAVSFKHKLILDDKPLGRPIAKDRQEIIRSIKAYEQREGHLPDVIGITRYDPITGQQILSELYSPKDFLP